ncbi:sensor histidine kinase [Sphingomonas sp. CROZ-RG-20F-R02-07]|uniref:sensor histidine kinase n=1 Tax=Sphingomonas sp. CROZ-RG-20F-R02-07 TaxID=2914832 RepID=UPI001F58F64A|nr:sensor histidine kinase [Sphingomonas sp. CROZ-RG-20F-R02-07]
MTTGSLPDSSPESTDMAGQLAAAHLALDAARAREAALRTELEHRVRNTLAITRSVFLRTMDNAETVEHARDHFVGRLDTLARYNARLAIGSQPRLDLETMIWDELLSMALGSDERIEVTGPEVLLQQRVAGLIGLALHELATNSVKFGVVGHPSAGGRLRVRWENKGQSVQLEWAESGVPIVASAPIGSGFGRDFIENALPYQLNADTRFEFVPGGLICRIAFEVSDRTTGEPFLS